MRLRCALLMMLLLPASAVWGQVYGSCICPNEIGHPFSAEEITETTQVLADGNRIHNETHGAVYRDSQGRTRNEHEFVPLFAGADRVVTINIFDPVQKISITLEPGSRTAHIHHIAPPSRVLNPDPGAVARPVRAPARTQVSIQREKLGPREIEGISAEGERVTETTPAGAVGNERPLVSLTELWLSRELNTAVFSKRVDPRTGETITRLVNIQRTEPDPALFQVPPDYSVKDDAGTR